MHEAAQQRVVDAVVNLFNETGTAAFVVCIPGTTPPVYIAAGEAGEIRAQLAMAELPIDEGGDG